jgi:protein-disulfide isomerase
MRLCHELNSTLEKLMLRYPQHLAVVVKHFVPPTALAGFKVPMAAECAADQGVFAEYHRAAFANGSLLHYSVGWETIAKEAGVADLATFRTCVVGGQKVRRVIQDYEEALDLGIRVTPTLFVNGTRVVGALSLDQLDSLVARTFKDRRRVRQQR